MELSYENNLNDYNRTKEVKNFDDSKAGVKGLVDTGVVKVPQIFITPPNDHVEFSTWRQPDLQIPVINLHGIAGDRHKEIVDQVRIASETWGFFQVVNHGVPVSVLENMIQGIKGFHEQDLEVKKEFYSRDMKRPVRFNSNFDLYQSRSATWRDTLAFTRAAIDHEPRDLPQVCREATCQYRNNVMELADQLFGLLSEAMELKPDHLMREMECAKNCSFMCHYYPACPEPELTLGTRNHSDPAFLTILLQDRIGGLQVLHDDQWVNIHPISGGLVINIGDFLQVISNDKFKSVQHRVLANHVGPRISAACFFTGEVSSKSYGPMQELTSDENPPLYRDFLISEYHAKFFSRELDERAGLHHFKL